MRNSVAVRVGQQVKMGQKIGRMGNTGFSFGEHLHYEVWRNGVRINPALNTYADINQTVSPGFNSGVTILRHDFSAPLFRAGRHRLTANLNVRTGAGTTNRIKRVNELTANSRQNATSTIPTANAVLRNGTIVAVLEVRQVGNDWWLRIPSGWIAGRHNNQDFVVRN